MNKKDKKILLVLFSLIILAQCAFLIYRWVRPSAYTLDGITFDCGSDISYTPTKKKWGTVWVGKSKGCTIRVTTVNDVDALENPEKMSGIMEYAEKALGKYKPRQNQPLSDIEVEVNGKLIQGKQAVCTHSNGKKCLVVTAFLLYDIKNNKVHYIGFEDKRRKKPEKPSKAFENIMKHFNKSLKLSPGIFTQQEYDIIQRVSKAQEDVVKNIENDVLQEFGISDEELAALLKRCKKNKKKKS